MNPRTLIAVQFALWAFFFNGIIPFAGSFLLPIVWIYDKRIFAGFVVVQLVQIIRILPFAISVIPAKYLNQLPASFFPFLIPVELLTIAGNLAFETWLAAFWLRRKMKKLAPDIQRFHT